MGQGPAAALLSSVMMVPGGRSGVRDLPLLPHQAFPEQGSDPLSIVLFVLPFAPLCFVNYFLWGTEEGKQAIVAQLC